MAEVLVQPVRRRKRAVHPAAVALAAVFTLSACSSVPDYANPVEWYRGVADWVSSDDSDTESGLVAATPPAEQRAPGGDQPFPSLATTPERPTPTPPEQRQQIAEGLAADRDRARYTDEVLRRGPASSASTQVAAAPPPPPAPVAAAPAPAPAEPPRPARPPERTETATMTAPVPVPPPAPLGSPPPPPGLERVTPPPAPPAVTRTLDAPPAPPPPPQMADVRSVYEQRLAESAPATAPVAAAPAPAPAPAPTVAAAPAAAPDPAPAMGVELAALPGGDAVAEQPSVSVQVADIYFAHGSASLDGRDRRVLREVIALQKARGGRIRVVGHASHRTGSMDLAAHKLANFSISVARANAVARELVQLGADRNVVLASARADLEPVYREIMPNGEAGNRRAEVFLDY